uniref:Uncharacterized protein n=1 Tax=Timema cristinae TaxID=61476 RepID=A0A7R9DCY9_TIMCR|nr:unnamed protein product [Timema cristinae]
MSTPRLESCVPLPLEDDVLEEIVNKATDWALMHVDPPWQGHNSTNTPRHCQYRTGSLLTTKTAAPKKKRRVICASWMRSVDHVRKLRELLFDTRLKARGLLEHVLEACYPLPLSPSSVPLPREHMT